MKNIILPVLLLVVTMFASGCGGGGSSSSDDDSGSNGSNIGTTKVSSVNADVNIDKTEKYNLDISGVNNTVTVKKNNSIQDLSISGANNEVFIEENTTVAGDFKVTGAGNTIFVPIGSKITFSDSGANNQLKTSFAPASFSGKSYNIVVLSGSGILARTGTALLKVSDTANTYEIIGDGPNITDSTGNYTYSAKGDTGTLTLIDSSFGQSKIVFVFASITSGVFITTVESDPDSSQKGSFIEKVE